MPEGWNTGETEYAKRLERIIVVGLKGSKSWSKVRCKPRILNKGNIWE